MQVDLFGNEIKEESRGWHGWTKQSYGIPYTGNKQKIAKYLFEHLPNGKRFVDLFGGGGAMTHYAMLNCQAKYESFVYNDIDHLVVDLFKRAVSGEFNPRVFKPKFISRDEYERTHNKDGYVGFLWSFGNNNNKGYLFGCDIEEYKRYAHNWVVFGDEEALRYLEHYFRDSYWWHIQRLYRGDDYILARKMFMNIILKIEAIRVCVEYGDKKVYDEFKDLSFNEFLALSNKKIVESINTYCLNIPKKNYKTKSNGLNELKHLQQLQQLERLQQLEQLQQLQQLERLQQLEQLQQLQRLEQLEICNMDYRDFEIQEGDVVYCDIPYDSKSVSYSVDFDFEAFIEWCKAQPVPIYYSYYTIGECLWSKPHRAANIKQGGGTLRYEGLMRIGGE